MAEQSSTAAPAAHATDVEVLQNFVGGQWRPSGTDAYADVHNPATGRSSPERRCRRAPISTPPFRPPSARSPPGATRPSSCAPARSSASSQLLEAALRGARADRHDRARQDDRRIARQRPPRHRVRRGRLRRAVADDGLRSRANRDRTSTPIVVRQPLGVVAAITPFNFPAMVPLWFLPFAVATGNTIVVKPSEQVPLSQRLMFQLLEQCDMPPGVINLVNGGARDRRGHLRSPGHPRRLVRRIDAGGARGLSARQRTPASACRRSAARRTSSSSCPTRISSASIDIITESFYGCAGERCLAGSVLVPVGEAHHEARDRLVESARSLKVGDGSRARRWPGFYRLLVQLVLLLKQGANGASKFPIG